MSPLISHWSPKKINMNKTSKIFGDIGDSLDQMPPHELESDLVKHLKFEVDKLSKEKALI